MKKSIQQIHREWSEGNFHSAAKKIKVSELQDGDIFYAAVPQPIFGKTAYTSHFFEFNTTVDDEPVAIVIGSGDARMLLRIQEGESKGAVVAFPPSALQTPYSNWPKRTVSLLNDYVKFRETHHTA